MTGVLLSINNENPLLRPSIDRIDSSLGYTLGNVQFVCYGLNLMKLDFSFKDAMDALTAMTQMSYIRDMIVEDTC